jgi:capsular exopolysaccharide synthesis family protein
MQTTNRALAVEERVSLPVETRSYALSRTLVALDRQAKSDSEAFRALRTHIMARHVEEGRRALAVCAATSGVGCTFVAANLAVALSQIGVKTLLVDANMRNPRVNRLFEPSSQVAGLQQCLLSIDDAFGDFIQPDVLPDLSILFAGGTPHNPQELLATDRYAELMSVCSRDYDMTIIDTPPASTCSDAHRISTVAGYSLVVARKNTSLVHDVRTLIAQLESDRARVIGTVMTEG